MVHPAMSSFYTIPAGQVLPVQVLTYVNLGLMPTLAVYLALHFRGRRASARANHDRLRDVLIIAAMVLCVGECLNALAVIQQPTFPQVQLCPVYCTYRVFGFLPITGLGQLIVTLRVRLIAFNSKRRRRRVWYLSLISAIAITPVSCFFWYQSYLESERTGDWDTEILNFSWVLYLNLMFPTISACTTAWMLHKAFRGVSTVDLHAASGITIPPPASMQPIGGSTFTLYIKEHTSTSPLPVSGVSGASGNSEAVLCPVTRSLSQPLVRAAAKAPSVMLSPSPVASQNVGLGDAASISPTSKSENPPSSAEEPRRLRSAMSVAADTAPTKLASAGSLQVLGLKRAASATISCSNPSLGVRTPLAPGGDTSPRPLDGARSPTAASSQQQAPSSSVQGERFMTATRPRQTTQRVPPVLQITLNRAFKALAISHLVCWAVVTSLVLSSASMSIFLRLRLVQLVIICEFYVEIQFKVYVRAQVAKAKVGPSHHGGGAADKPKSGRRGANGGGGGGGGGSGEAPRSPGRGWMATLWLGGAPEPAGNNRVGPSPLVFFDPESAIHSVGIATIVLGGEAQHS